MSAEANQVGAASSDGNVLVQIAQGLATKPAFLLIFGIFTASLVYTVALLSQKAPLVYIEFTGILTAVALVVSLVAMRFDVRPDLTTGDREVDACLADIQDGLTSALKSSQSIFRDQITARIADLRSEAFDNNANGGKFRILRDRIKNASLRLQDLHR